MLTDSRVVMLWRRVASLESAKAFTRSTLNLPVVGEDEYSTMYDAGGLLLGLWRQDERLLIQENSCSALNFVKYDLAANPASELVFVPANMESSVQRLRNAIDLHTSPVESSVGLTLPFFDQDGNLISLFRPSEAGLSGTAGLRLRALMRNRGVDNGTVGGTTTDNPMGIVSIRLLVSNLPKSQNFYKDILGLGTLQVGTERAAFDVGTVTLLIQAEPINGLVQSLSKANLLLTDWIVFHVQDISAATQGLTRRGVSFPAGIETSGIGQMAYFQDPDGHSLVLWQPTSDSTHLKINFFPVLNRILSEQT